MNKIKLPKSCRLLAEFFADKREGNNSLYKRRGGFKREDIVAGAMGEMGAMLWLQNKGYEVGNPDLTIHKKRSFDADLTDGSYCFHVKTQTTESRNKYGDSWILQRTDKLVSEPKPKHYLILTSVDIEQGEVTILGAVNAKNVKYGECRLEWFRKTKVALYLDNIKRKFTLKDKSC